jgi:hypothetical protein
MSSPLSSADVAHYAREGYLVPNYRLEPELLGELQLALAQLIRDNPGVRPEKLVSAHVAGDNGEGVKGVKKFLDLAMHGPILDMVEQVIGPDIILWGCHVFSKPAGDGFETPWHQDGHYWPIRPLATCTVWVALEPSTRENGCLRIIPRSHANKQLHAHLFEDRQDLVLNQRMVDFLTSVTLQKLVDDQLAKGLQVEEAPSLKRAISALPVSQPIRINAPNSVFALGNAFSKA